MTALKVASLNMSGAQERGSGMQEKGKFARFLNRCKQWVIGERVDVILGQEHNLDPARESELKRMAEHKGFALVIAFAPRAADGVHRGGTLVLVNTETVEWPQLNAEREKRVLVRIPGATVVSVGWGDRLIKVGSIYAPSPPSLRVSFFQEMRKWITLDMFLGGDWNCVPDVTLDVQSSDPFRYKNIGGALLEEVTGEVGLVDFRRQQLGGHREATRQPLGAVHTRLGPDVVITRLDRFYIPTDEAHEDLLPSFQVRWDVVWSKEPRDHAAIVLTLESADGEAGHERHTIREEITAEAKVQEEQVRLTEAAYAKGGKEWQKWERAHAAMRSYLLDETARRKTRERKEIKEVRRSLATLQKIVQKKGPSLGAVEHRKQLTEKLYTLEHPETKNEESLRSQVASAQLSDVATKRYFRNYKAAAKQQWINGVKTAEWEEGVDPEFAGRTTSPKEVSGEIAKYWKMIYGPKVIDEEAGRDLLEGLPDEEGVRRGGLRAKQISRASREAMDAEVTDGEVEGVMENLPLGKSAGPDRIPNGVYKGLSKFFAPKLGAVLREAQRAGRLPPTFLQGDISVLYKKGERDDPRNYRPITLLQNAYKIFTRIHARRMKQVVHEFVSECQKGFVPHAFIAECTMLMNAVEAYINDEAHPERGGMMLFLDMEKAFDRVSYDFLLRAAEAVGFGERFLTTLRMMYDTERAPKRRIYANGYYSDWFSIKSGVAQGCPLSPLLFLLIAETLKIATAQNPDFHGIEIGGRRIKTSQFADDTTLFLRDSRDLTAAEESIQKWCRASGMRENYKKREGLAMGRYRRGRRARTLPKSVTWVKEGMWAIVLGVPIGNDVNHDAFWKKKISAIQGKTQRMVGLFRASYFGRNLIVQAKYFGSLRYWLYSIPMSKTTRVTVQMDADTLWWSKTPSLDEPRTRVRRFVAQNTAIGPRGKGGLKTMDWSGHVTAVQSEWILRWAMPPDRDECAWKHVLHHMVLVDKRGYDKFPEGRGIFFCRMTPADKLRLMRGIPKKATYIKECIRAFWSLKLKQDLEDMGHLRAESFWHNARFRLDSTPTERKSFSTIMNVQILGDAFDSSTGKPRTQENWAEWVCEYYTQHDGAPPDEGFVLTVSRRMVALVDQIPSEVVEEVTQQSGVSPEFKDNEVIALVSPNVQDQSDDIYARVAQGGYEHVWVDRYGVGHNTGRLVQKGSKVACKVATWTTKSGTRIRGPADAVFPKTKGWLLDGKKVKLDALRTSAVTAALAMRKFVVPASEKAWNDRRGKKLRWKEGWKLRSFYATPRDQVTWLKFQHRTLYTVGHRTDVDNTCQACDERESQLHLITCGVIRAEFWDPVLNLLVGMGMSAPESVVDFLITGQLSDTETMHSDYAGVIFLAFRCLYAAVVNSRVEGTPIDLRSALRRMACMLVSRLNASGEKWKGWVQKGANKRRPHIIPPKHQSKGVIFTDEMGYYSVHGDIVGMKKRLIEEARSEAPRTNEAPRRRQTVPPTTQDANTRAAEHFLARHAPQPSETAMAEAQEEAGGVTEEMDTQPEEWRDMSGDALTVAEARARGLHAQCTLASVRNLRRNPEYSRERLAERCHGGRYVNDIRCPDWPVLMEPITRAGEVIKRVSLREIQEGEMGDFRAGVVIMSEHVVCFYNSGDGDFRVYDNDSRERREGRPRRMSAREILESMNDGPYNAIIGILLEASDLSGRLGPPLTTLFDRRRR